jgi:nitrogen fixation/metabolism regulation signal transduction histidine kinase
MSEAVIVFDQKSVVSLFNKSAEKIFNTKSYEIVGKSIDYLNNGMLGFLVERLQVLKNSNLNFERKLQIEKEEKILHSVYHH